MNRLTIIIVLLGLLTGCVQFKPAVLYDAEATAPKPPKPEDISLYVATEIYSDDTLNVWGVMNEAGKEARLSKDIKKEGEASIFIKWDRSKAEWTGFGAGWDNWFGKDLTRIVDYAAVRFYVRTEKGKMFGLPMVLSLEDYTGVSGYAYAANKYFERYAIDEEWQKVVVPLAAFNVNEFGLDLTNIKQMQFELQQSGSIYIDEIDIVPYEEKPQKPWMTLEKLPSPLTLPKTLFDDAFINDNGYGLMSYACQDFRLSDSDTHTGSQAIYLKWDQAISNCTNIHFGLSWHKWRPFDITPIWEKAAVELYIKIPKTNKEIPFVKLVMQDYGFQTSELRITEAHTDAGAFTGDWQRVVCPLSDFEGLWNPNNAKQLNVGMEGAGEIWIDDITLISLK